MSEQSGPTATVHRKVAFLGGGRMGEALVSELVR